MVSKIVTGDYVECVDDAAHSYVSDKLRLGGLYKVRNVVRKDMDVPSLRLVGVKLPRTEQGVEHMWGLARFRFVYRPKKTLLAGFLLASPSRSEIQGGTVVSYWDNQHIAQERIYEDDESRTIIHIQTWID